MSRPRPPIRACLFDMDGLLIDSEDKYTSCVNTVLAENGRPPMPWSIKAQLQGRPGPEAGQIFQKWARLPIPEEAFLARQAELQREVFPSCQLLPGVDALVRTLTTTARTNDRRKRRVEVALATSSHTRNYDLKTTHLPDFFGRFHPDSIVKGDDPRIPRGKGKPSPDIYLLALETINAGIRAARRGQHAGGDEEEDEEIKPEECLVFEDSVPGVEAGRRAGMQAVWVPYEGLWAEFRDREPEVLAGRSGMVHGGKVGGIGGAPGEIGDGWAVRLKSLADFPYADFGIEV